MTRRVSLWQLLVFMSLVAACLGLSIAGEVEAACLTWFLPGAYLSTGILRTSSPRLAGRALISARYGAIGGAVSCFAGLVPQSIAIHLASPFHFLPFHVELILSLAFALTIGAAEGAIYGWLSAKIFADWNRRRRWRMRREKYGPGK